VTKFTVIVASALTLATTGCKLTAPATASTDSAEAPAQSESVPPATATPSEPSLPTPTTEQSPGPHTPPIIVSTDVVTIPAEENPTPAPLPTSKWVDATLQPGGWAIVIKADGGWPKNGHWADGKMVGESLFNYTNIYRAAVQDEAVYLYPRGGGYSWDSRVTYVVKALADGETMIVYADALKGVAPTADYTPPNICPDGKWCAQ
jgi:hypothetical protein